MPDTLHDHSFSPAPVIPGLEQLQQQLVTALLVTAEQMGLHPVLSGCFRTPRLAFDLPQDQRALNLIIALDGQNIRCADLETHRVLTLAHLRGTDPKDLPKTLLLFRPILLNGRVIHGQMSGLRLTLTDPDPCERVTFPTPRFGTLPANAQLAGFSVDVNTTLLKHLDESKVPNRVDIVYTWVDGSDPNWSANRQRHSPDAPSADAEHKARFDNNDELLYSLRSLFRYFNGINRVYLVTDSQVPVFLREFADQVTVIDHSEIMGNDVARPTFNSHVIESCLHRIKGLTPQYLYLNDDFLFAKPTCPADFFELNGNAKCFFSRRSFIPEGQITAQTLAVDAAAMNLRDLLQQRYTQTITRKFQHTPVATHRDILFEMEDTFPESFAQLRLNRFRSQNDLSPSSSFYLHYALLTDRAQPSKIQYRYYETSAGTLPLKLFKLSVEQDYQRPKVHCVNATGDKSVSRLNSWALHTQLKALYPPADTPKPTNTPFDTLRQRVYQQLLALRKRLSRTNK